MTDRHVDGHPLLDLVVLADDMIDRGLQRIRLGFGEETDMAEIDAEQGRVGGARELRPAQQAAVPAEHEDQFDPERGGVIGRDHVVAAQVEQFGLVPQHPRGDPGGDELVQHPLGDLPDDRTAWVGDHQDFPAHWAFRLIDDPRHARWTARNRNQDRRWRRNRR